MRTRTLVLFLSVSFFAPPEISNEDCYLGGYRKGTITKRMSHFLWIGVAAGFLLGPLVGLMMSDCIPW